MLFHHWCCIVLTLILGIIVIAYAANRRARCEIRCLLLFFAIQLTCLISIPFCVYDRFSGKTSFVVLKLMKFFSKWTGTNVETRKTHDLLHKDSPCVIICNHQSGIDSLVVADVFPSRCTFMMDGFLAYVPLINIVAWLINVFFIDRSNPEKNMSTMTKFIETMKKKNLKLWVFPEGTHNFALEGMLPFKKGAFNLAVDAQLPIVPVVASSMNCFFSHSENYFDSDGEIIVQVLDPIHTTGLTREDVPALTEEVREKMIAVYENITKEVNAKMALKRGISNSSYVS